MQTLVSIILPLFLPLLLKICTVCSILLLCEFYKKLQEEHQRLGEMDWDEVVGDVRVVIPVCSSLPFSFPGGREKTSPLSQTEVSPCIYNIWTSVY